ncbi:MAG: hypothetical protein Rubg2KO_02050 [Rubricoccaceae bacterium]
MLLSIEKSLTTVQRICGPFGRIREESVRLGSYVRCDTIPPRRMRSLILLAIALVAPPVLAQTPGSCALGTAQEFLSAGDVQASVFNNGNLFFGGSTTSADGYIVPKASGNSPMFAAGIWVSGTVDGESRVSAARYNGYLFRPGPLNADGTLPNASDCSAYDRIYVVGASEIAAYESGQAPARDLADWPVGLGAPTVDADGDPAAVSSRDQTIDLAAGERPDLHGSEMAFWVMNDVGAPRAGNQTAPLGFEVQVTAFVIATDGDLPGASEASFYRFRVINRSTSTIENARWSFFTDPDLGDAGDDFVGVDTTRSLAFVYNANNEDRSYGSPPPAVGYDILSHELAATSSFLGAGGPPGAEDPNTPERYYNYMQGLWGNGTPYYEQGNGFQQPGAPTTTFMFAGDPVTESLYSEVNTDGNGTDSPQGDRRYVATVAFGALAPGDTTRVDMAILYALGTSNLDSITELRGVSDGVQDAYAAGLLFRSPRLVAHEDGPQLNELVLGSVHPNPTASSLTVPYRLASPSPVELAVYDVLGRQVIELVNARQPEGTQEAVLDASALAPGVYVVRLRAGEETRTTRITVVR